MLQEIKEGGVISANQKAVQDFLNTLVDPDRFFKFVDWMLKNTKNNIPGHELQSRGKDVAKFESLPAIPDGWSFGAGAQSFAFDGDPDQSFFEVTVRRADERTATAAAYAATGEPEGDWVGDWVDVEMLVGHRRPLLAGEFDVSVFPSPTSAAYSVYPSLTYRNKKKIMARGDATFLPEGEKGVFKKNSAQSEYAFTFGFLPSGRLTVIIHKIFNKASLVPGGTHDRFNAVFAFDRAMGLAVSARSALLQFREQEKEEKYGGGPIPGGTM